MSRIKPAQWAWNPGLVDSRWRGRAAQFLAAVSPHEVVPTFLVNGKLAEEAVTPGNFPTSRVVGPDGPLVRFNSSGRDGDCWKIPDSNYNLLEGRDTFTVGMYLRTNYGSTSADEDTLFGHWTGMDALGARTMKVMFRWDSLNQNFDFDVSSNGTTEQNVLAGTAGAAFDDGEMHTLVVAAKAGAVTLYLDGVVLGAGSFTGTIASTGGGNGPGDWEMPGGHNVSQDTRDSPRVDFGCGFVSKEGWGIGDAQAWHSDPYGPFRLSRLTPVKYQESTTRILRPAVADIVKPAEWTIDPRLVRKEWGWFWEKMGFLLPIWDNPKEGNPTQCFNGPGANFTAQLGVSGTVDYTWEATPAGIALRTNKPETTFNSSNRHGIEVTPVADIASDQEGTLLLVCQPMMVGQFLWATNERGTWDDIAFMQFTPGGIPVFAMKDGAIVRWKFSWNVGFPNGSLLVIAMRGGPGGNRQWVNGVPANGTYLNGSAASTEWFGDISGTLDEFIFGGPEGASAGNQPSKCGFVFAAYFPVALTDSQVAQWSADPFGPIRRARSILIVVTVTDLEETLEGFRWRDDDGNEAAATWAQVQDVNHTVAPDGTTRLRIVLQGPAGGAYQIDCAADGTEDWFPLDGPP